MELEAAIALSPDDYPNPRWSLFGNHMQRERLDEAEKLLGELLPLLSDSIKFVEELEMLYLAVRNVEKAQEMTDRVFELEEIYRRPR